VKDENGDLLADSYSIFNFSHLLNIRRASNIRQIEAYTAEPLVPDASPIEFEITIAKLKRYKTSESDKIPAEIFQIDGEMLQSEIHSSLILFGIRKNFLISGRSLLLYQFTRMLKLTVVIIVGYRYYQFHKNFIQYPFLKVEFMYR
jgi:hypothetical protein